jgi:hypothetical protein
MEYKLHRVAPNSDGWVRPSPWRLGAASVGEYVKENGFGHEDWNFNFSFASNGEMLGYTVARPAARLATEKFGVILATYDPQGWSAVGYYDGAKFTTQTGSYHSAAVRQMAVDVFELAEKNRVAPRYRHMTLLGIEQIIQEELIYSCWVTPRNKVFVFEPPVRIPKRIFNPGRQRMVTSFNLSEDQFNQITKLEPGAIDQSVVVEQEEGERTLKLHQSIERKPGLVAAFKSSLNSFACVICAFDFESRYGPLGKAFIECHHIRPVAEMRPGEKTKLSELQAVCSNCHRMLHKASPMLTVEQLREMVK